MSNAAHHRQLTDEQVAEIAEIKRLEVEMIDLVEHLARHKNNGPIGQREFALAKTNLQQARFWAIEGITA